MNPSQAGGFFFRIRHVQTGKQLETNTKGDTYLAASNTLLYQIWIWDGKYLKNTKANLTLQSDANGKISAKVRTASNNQIWTIVNSNNVTRFQNVATLKFLDVDSQNLTSSTSDQLLNPDWNLVAGRFLIFFAIQNNTKFLFY